MIKKRSFTVIILLLIFFLSFSVSADKVQVKNDVEVESQKEFVSDIYNNYADQDFAYVYNQLYPAIKESISQEEYVKFQADNFDHYNLEISEIKVMDLKELEEVPEQFTSYLSQDEVKLINSVTVSYLASFYSNSEREIEKEVYICLKAVKDADENEMEEEEEKERLFLLWDPEIMND